MDIFRVRSVLQLFVSACILCCLDKVTTLLVGRLQWEVIILDCFNDSSIKMQLISTVNVLDMQTEGCAMVNAANTVAWEARPQHKFIGAWIIA